MLDPKRIRSEPELLAKQLLKKKFELDVMRLAELDGKRKELQLQTEALQNERNSRSKVIGQAKAAGEDISETLANMESIKLGLEDKKVKLGQLQDELNEYLMGVPNAPHESVPEGDDETANQLIDSWGEP
ncbi:MAG: serine--tRNA ligase, partial [Gammaproteobacteria bacterium]|nr:serine--tRNA ligase [Gammaproteobacteria bacterium]